MLLTDHHKVASQQGKGLRSRCFGEISLHQMARASATTTTSTTSPAHTSFRLNTWLVAEQPTRSTLAKGLVPACNRCLRKSNKLPGCWCPSKMHCVALATRRCLSQTQVRRITFGIVDLSTPRWIKSCVIRGDRNRHGRIW